MTGTIADRILKLLTQKPGLDDDELARALAIEPRQTVNQVCRKLADNGVIVRERGARGKIVNSLAAGPPRARIIAGDGDRRQPIPVGMVSPAANRPPSDLGRTLLIIPCSKAKTDRAGDTKPGPPITNSLPRDVAEELLLARAALRRTISVDETTKIPACDRYDGSLYRAARPALGSLAKSGAHILILSGGYGIVSGDEPIGTYDQPLKAASWPNFILPRTLIAYARRHEIQSVRAFVAATSPYRNVLRRVRWHEAYIEDALVLTPETGPGGTIKSPATIGEAITAFASGTLDDHWQSSYRLSLQAQSF